ncbi:MAG: flippase [Burkholderiales bacterium]|nr:flippase [Burkholderiales bacterium]
MSLKRNTLWNLAGSAVPLLAGVAFIPYTLRHLGGESFGVLTLIWGLIGYFSLFDFGVGRALTFQLSRLTASDLDTQGAAVLRAGLLLTGVAGLLGVCVVALLTPGLASQWLQISPVLQEDARHAFFIAAAGVLPTTLASGLRGAMEGLNRFAASNAGRMILGTWMFALPAVSVSTHGPSLGWIAMYLVLGRCLVLVMMALQLRKILFSRFAALTRQHFNGLWHYGFWVIVTGIVGPLMVYGDRFFVSATVGADQLSLYVIPQEALLRLLLIPAALTSALMPRLAAMNDVQVMQSYHHIYRKVGWVMLVLCGLAGLAAYPALSIWISSTFAHDAMPVVLVLCIGIWINSLASIPFILIQAKGNPRVTAVFHVVELGLYLVVLWALTSRWGLLGAALAWLVRVTLDWVLLRFAVRRLYGV